VDPNLLSVVEAARRLGISRRMLYLLIQDGDLYAERVDGRLFVRDTDLRRFASAIEAEGLLVHPNARTWSDGTPEPDGTLLIRSKEAARRMRVSRQRVYQLIQNHDLAAYRIGRCTLLRPSDVTAFDKRRKRRGHDTGEDAKILKRDPIASGETHEQD
jgi:excisionase family DNA binding protein